MRIDRPGRRRECGTVSLARFIHLDVGASVGVEVVIQFGDNHRQSFVAVGDDEIAARFMAAIVAVFGVQTPDELVGKPCFALRIFGDAADPIEGIESGDGNRLTKFGWAISNRQGVLKPAQDVTGPELAEMEGRIVALRRSKAEPPAEWAKTKPAPDGREQ